MLRAVLRGVDILEQSLVRLGRGRKEDKGLAVEDWFESEGEENIGMRTVFGFSAEWRSALCLGGT